MTLDHVAYPTDAPYLRMVHRCKVCRRYLRRTVTGWRHSGLRP